jgi:hypothetical protein
MLEGKPLHVRRRIAIIVTGIAGIVLILLMFLVYSHPQPVRPDPEQKIVNGYTIFVGKIQSLFHRK